MTTANDERKHKADVWEECKMLSLSPNGFGDERSELWLILLHVDAEERLREIPEAQHPDEHQIHLDTDRSFVLYPSENDRGELQSDLHELLLAIFRRRPKLSYFQGYHDIISVLFLTLPPQWRLPCAEKMSLQRLRDSMGLGLEPVLGLMRVLHNLLRLVDPHYTDILERNTPLPYFALSHILTLFSHDMPTLPLIQHVFDYLLCRPPIAVLYLVAALTLARKPEVLRLEETGEDGMLHSLLTSLPNIIDDEAIKAEEEHRHVKHEELDLSPPPENAGCTDVVESVMPDNDENESGTVDPPDPPNSPPSAEARPLSIDSILIETPEEGEKKFISKRPSTPAADIPTLSLTTLLKKADTLMEQYPPTHASLLLSSIMGPQSVIFTWSPSRKELPSDDMAERMVDHPELVVYPYLPEVSTKEQDKTPKSRRHRRLSKRDRRARTLLAGAILVVAIAMAVYGMKNGMIPSVRRSHSFIKECQKVRKWIGGFAAAVGQRLNELVLL